MKGFTLLLPIAAEVWRELRTAPSHTPFTRTIRRARPIAQEIMSAPVIMTPCAPCRYVRPFPAHIVISGAARSHEHLPQNSIFPPSDLSPGARASADWPVGRRHRRHQRQPRGRRARRYGGGGG